MTDGVEFVLRGGNLLLQRFVTRDDGRSTFIVVAVGRTTLSQQRRTLQTQVFDLLVIFACLGATATFFAPQSQPFLQRGRELIQVLLPDDKHFGRRLLLKVAAVEPMQNFDDAAASVL